MKSILVVKKSIFLVVRTGTGRSDSKDDHLTTYNFEIQKK